MSWLMVLFWSSLVVKVSSNYRVVEDTPDMSCSLATPEIEFGELYTRVILDDNLLDTWQEARVGYVETLVELQYIGCIPLNVRDAIKHTTVLTDRGVRQCYSACDDNTVFGLTSREGITTCLCFGDVVKDRIDKFGDCANECGVFACGSNGYASLYEKVKVGNAEGQNSNRSESCLTISKHRYEWKECSDRLTRVACFKDTVDDATSLKTSSICIFRCGVIWLQGINMCSNDKKYPMTYRQSLPENGSKQHWTGVIQTIAVRKSRGVDSRRVKAFGYVKKSDDGYILNFDDGSDPIYHSICVDEMVSSSTDKPGTSQSPESSSTSLLTSTDVDTTSPLRSSHTSTSTTITLENTSIADTSAANLITTTATKITTAMSTENKHMTESMGSPNGDKTEEESNVGLSIGLPVAALILVGIGVVVFVLWKRRRKPFKEKETPSSLQNNVIYQNNNAMIAQTNNAYEEVDKPSDVLNDQANVYDLCKDEDKDSQHEYGNSYFVLEKAKDGEEYSEVSKSREKKSEYSEVSKTRDKKTESNDNAYFVLEKEEKTPDPEDTGYGSSNSVNFKSKGASNVPDRHVYRQHCWFC